MAVSCLRDYVLEVLLPSRIGAPMFPWNPSQWTEPYLLSLIGQPESSRLEYKSGKALAKREDKERLIGTDFSDGIGFC